MKKLILIVVAMAMTLSVAEAFAKKSDNKIETVQFVTNIDCDHCSKKIMNYMPTQKGVKEVKVDLPSKTVTISYDNAKTNVEQLVERFDKIDVDAKEVGNKDCCKAKKLTPACK